MIDNFLVNGIIFLAIQKEKGMISKNEQKDKSYNSNNYHNDCWYNRIFTSYANYSAKAK